MRKSKHYRLPEYIRSKIDEIASLYETTATEALIMMLIPGYNWVKKKAAREKMGTTAAETTTPASSCEADNHNLPQDEKIVTDEELDRMIEELGP